MISQFRFQKSSANSHYGWSAVLKPHSCTALSQWPPRSAQHGARSEGPCSSPHAQSPISAGRIIALYITLMHADVEYIQAKDSSISVNKNFVPATSVLKNEIVIAYFHSLITQQEEAVYLINTLLGSLLRPNRYSEDENGSWFFEERQHWSEDESSQHQGADWVSH